MSDSQKINCTVKSCVYQDENAQRCKLQAINVVPTRKCNTSKPDESKCGSYECK